uniref:Epithelial cell adhesion molecule n=1 Tax=Hucho hucho TaxID=62062 RepID=A0A4W5M2W1_9TELE
MKIWIALLLATFAVGASAQCTCENLKWAVCDDTPCQCSVMVGADEKQFLNCSKLIPKCFLMKAEMYRARKGLSTRTGGKPVKTAFVDNDGIYDPDCETTGAFRAKQCNNTKECWCVNSAGVRRTDKGDESLRCEKLVETYWVRLELKHKPVSKAVDAAKLQAAIATAIQNRYSFDKTLVKEVEYDPEARLIVVDVQKEKGDRKADLSHLAYYMEKDVKVLPLFKDQDKFEPSVDGQKLEMENILVYYVDEEAPTFTMKRLPGGVIAVIVVVILAVATGLLVLYLARRREQRYSKAEPREMEAM